MVIILVNIKNKFHISAHPCIILYIMTLGFSTLLLCSYNCPYNPNKITPTDLNSIVRIGILSHMHDKCLPAYYTHAFSAKKKKDGRLSNKILMHN